jgi:cell cycle protein kinase DBF2
VPELEGEEDVGYFDDFSNETDMAKYKEVYEKQMELSRLAERGEPLKKSAFVGFTFRFFSLPPPPPRPGLLLMM